MLDAGAREKDKTFPEIIPVDRTILGAGLSTLYIFKPYEASH